MFDITEIRKDFPILGREVNGRPLVYLDNAATTQLPEPVLQGLCDHYHNNNANVHRGIHTLSNESTRKLEAAREKAAMFIGAESSDDIVFTSGTTDSLNLAAYALEQLIRPGDEIITTVMEHHSNFVPWQFLAFRNTAVFKVCPLTENGDLDLEALAGLITPKTKVVACTQVSNVLGTVNPIKKIADMAHSVGAVMVCDGAQGIRHELTNVQDMGCDMYAFSGHKMMAPTGTGVLYIRKELRDKLNPVRFGGGMVDTVTIERTTFEQAPFSWEAGTPNYPGAYALGCAMDYLNSIGRSEYAAGSSEGFLGRYDYAAGSSEGFLGRCVYAAGSSEGFLGRCDYVAHEKKLLEKTVAGLRSIDRVHVLGDPQIRSGCVSFYVDNAHPYDIATLLDKLGIAVRSGTHCAQPLLQSYGIEHTVRVAPAFYNTEDEIDYFLDKLAFVLGLL